MAGGSSGGGKPGGPKKANIQIIPLIDVVFFLLATFVLFTLSLNRSEGLTVTLPPTETGKDRDPNGTVTVTVEVDGSLGWNKDRISLEVFIDRLRDFYAREGKSGRILINGDENAYFSQVRYVFDQARMIGFEKVFLETRMKPRG